jgi:hypothetical protein
MKSDLLEPEEQLELLAEGGASQRGDDAGGDQIQQRRLVREHMGRTWSQGKHGEKREAHWYQWLSLIVSLMAVFLLLPAASLTCAALNQYIMPRVTESPMK